ncbi:MAG: HAMP domain-containing histidine kinase [Leptolyngbyaceae cyanobacterium SM1_1_3]|nr:HAMP domain-containing histidine kinase [Leptolyngbyaceae cyanobacterium SM1_1_3]NJN03381.1 HAMP domain-containing histidine kinase [Leptolyngbyaceae cyanobacterium RM1_1_2]
MATNRFLTDGALVLQQLEISSAALKIDSVVSDLPLFELQVEAEGAGWELAQCFERYPNLPGAILLEQGQLLGLISRQTFLEYLLRPQGLELFLQQPLRVLHSYARSPALMVSAQTTIITAAQKALRRSPECQHHPLVVQCQNVYRLLSAADLNVAYWQIRGIETQVRYERAQAQMLQSHKMAALGRLVDGVAHELSDPISFIWGNLAHLEGYGQQLLALVAAYETCCPQPPSQVKQLAAAVDLSYLQADLPKTLASIRSGAARIKRLGASLQNFCHIDEVYPKPASLHDLLDSVLLLLMSRLDTSIHIVRQYGRLPPVSCFAGQLAQVLMNILSNAVDTLLEQTIRCTLAAEFSQPISAQADYLPTLTLRTWLCSSPVQCLEDGDRRWVVLQISDNGPGLSPEIEQQVQQGFAEEKRMMKETSLAISYHIITGRHGGQFYVRSQTFTQEKPPADVGSQFEIWLPLA